VDGYSWPTDYDRLAEQASDGWADTVAALPQGSVATGRVIGRQPFGVFVEITGVAGALGLAEITTMPRGVTLPPVGAVVRGTVIGHSAHNCQVRLRLVDQQG
jgi:hypothetical protein